RSQDGAPRGDALSEPPAVLGRVRGLREARATGASRPRGAVPDREDGDPFGQEPRPWRGEPATLPAGRRAGGERAVPGVGPLPARDAPRADGRQAARPHGVHRDAAPAARPRRGQEGPREALTTEPPIRVTGS